jgi:chaperone required for assembly of F1-ATPase
MSSMRDLFERRPDNDPMAAARRGARPALRRRFYRTVAVAATQDGYGVALDGKPARTPAGCVLAGPTLPLAEAIAAEWEAQRETIDPAKMPLTRLANAIIDGVARAPGPVAAEIKKYLSSDLVFYRATEPQQLRDRQAEHWDPILAWARNTLGATFKSGEGIVHLAQPSAALAAAAGFIPSDPWRLGAVHVATTLTGSALIALAMLDGGLLVETAWRASHVDEDWNIEQWGRDEAAMERHSFRLAEFQAAATVMKLSKS